ncbi:NACHT domain- and WD repeat-containing protein 1 isoform X1 [Rhodnius prolixus]|uniref:NACHT domain- and WD repeat-containing protein 1 isoform X1 n=1 Tax=Rhodnius prolixus TaxID=13249 RepID=UPI003D18A75F
MGSNCSSGQTHKDRDSISTRSEESPSYQIAQKDTKKEEKKENSKNNSKTSAQSKATVNSGVVLGVSKVDPAPQPAPQERSCLPSVTDSISAGSPGPKGKEVEPIKPLTSPDSIPSIKEKKIVIYICAADSQDCKVEKSLLHSEVYPTLRDKCRRASFELHIVDLHWSLQDQTAEPGELCLQELSRQSENYVIPVVFLNNHLGTPLLPKTLESADFQMVTSQESQRSDVLLKWYKLDTLAQPACYRLLPPSTHVPGLKSGDNVVRDKALGEWRKEVDTILSVMLAVFAQELRDIYLTTVVEQAIQNTVLMSRELAKRCVWLCRGGSKGPEGTSVGDLELKRRLEALQKTLKNELIDNHIIHLMPASNPDYSQQPEYLSQVTTNLSKQLQSIVDSIIEDHETKEAQNTMKCGLPMYLLKEISFHNKMGERIAQSSVNRQVLLENMYNSPSSLLVFYGPEGCGKTTLLSRLAYNSTQSETKVYFRLVGRTKKSSTLIQLLQSLLEELSPQRSARIHSLENYTKLFPQCLADATKQGKILVIIDAIDQFRDFGENCASWIPSNVPVNCKLVLSCTEKNSVFLDSIKKHLESTDAKFISIPDLEKSERESILMSSILEYNHSINPKVHDCILNAVNTCTLPLYIKAVAWQTTWCNEYSIDLEIKSDLDSQLETILQQLEIIFGKEQVEKIFALICCAKWGVQDSEVIDILSSDPHFHTSTTYLPWAGACLFWAKFTRHLLPFLAWIDDRTLRLRDAALLRVCLKRYEKKLSWGYSTLCKYFNGQLWNEVSEIKARKMDQPDSYEETYNTRKLEELPYLLIKTEKSALKLTINHEWLLKKLCATDAQQVLDDIYMETKTVDTDWLKTFIEVNYEALCYDGRQLYSLLHTYLKDHTTTSLASTWSKIAENPPIPSLIKAEVTEKDTSGLNQTDSFDILRRLPNSQNFVVSVRTKECEISVWDIAKCRRVRTLKGMPQPTALQMVDDFKCIVLCNRELRSYDLDKGVLLCKLKGVMNQKMPYFGLHDSSHLVALSRNRMYVNLMNLETGDLVTTFKAGEDRFLNSLLVSGDGKTLVCGDETQKPFPLLVWNLASRKLLYDLRIPQHEFLSHLSAITHHGNYVCCVAKEVVENTPNYLVVYDLQSGTLFKKWKPGVDCVSVEISSKEGCLVTGHVDAMILTSDLVTRNCRSRLKGHTSPVDFLRLSPNGSICLSMSSHLKDRSVRLWDLNKGTMLAVYTPEEQVTSCELTDNWVVMSTKGNPNLITLEIRGGDFVSGEIGESKYGTEEGFKLSVLEES